MKLSIIKRIANLAPCWSGIFGAFNLHAQDASPQEKPIITTEANLPRYTYKLLTETVSELLTNEGADKNEEGLLLIHPKRSIELLKEQMSK